MSLGSLKDRNELGVVTPREVWRGSRSLWRLLRSLRRHGDEAIVQKGLESLKEGVPEGKGKLRSSLSGSYRHTSPMIP